MFREFRSKAMMKAEAAAARAATTAETRWVNRFGRARVNAESHVDSLRCDLPRDRDADWDLW